MKIRTKLLSIYVPILILCIAGTGLSSYFLALDALKKREYGALRLLADSVVENEVGDRVALLKSSSLESVPSFVEAYQNEVFSALSTLSNETGRAFFVYSQNSQTVIYASKNNIVRPLMLISSATFLDESQGLGEYSVGSANGLFVKTIHQDWQWDIYVIQDSSVLSSGLGGIGFAVLAYTLLSSIIAFLLLDFATSNIILKRIYQLMEATKHIAATSEAVEVSDSRSDELSELATDISHMSKTISFAMESEKRASEAKSNMLAVLSHEIRTPLNGISGLAKLLTNSDLNDKEQQYARDLLSSSLSLTSIMNDVLDFSKIEAGKMSLDFSVFDVKAEVQKVANLFAVSASENGTTINVYFADEKDLAVEGDLVRIRQVVTNFISNAVKFTRNGLIEVYVSYTDDQKLVVSVADTGAGIPKDKLHSIFDTFTQSDSSVSREYGGTGLGLTICEKLVNMMNGEIKLSSEIGKGSRFVVILPATFMPIDKARALPQINHEDITLEGSVLVVEDNDVNALIIKEMLRQMGLQYQHAGNGAAAVEMAQNNRFDLILMDVHMPVMDGVTATKKLIAMGVKTPILGLTAEALASRHKAFVEAGMSLILTKPITIEALSEALLAFLKKSTDATH